jgi:hypothetical protein
MLGDYDTMSLADRGSTIAVISEAGVAPDATLVDLVEAIRAIPYGRSSDRTVDGMLREQRGTCSTKHLFLARVLTERFPDTEPVIVHRVYTLDRDRARELFGASVAAAVPDDGLVDVHRYLAITLGGRRVEIDATFSGPAWDGLSSLPLACGAGMDYQAGDDPEAEKQALEELHCNPAIREPFIAALSSTPRHSTLSEARTPRPRPRSPHRSSHSPPSG